MSILTAFIIGAGRNVGDGVATVLKSHGYKVAFGSRNPDVPYITGKGFVPVTIDASSPTSIAAAFETVKRDIGVPNVVVFNAAHAISSPTPGDPLSLSTSDFDTTLKLITGLFAASKHALDGFKDIPDSAPKVFITTSNALHFLPPSKERSGWTSLGFQKVGEAHLMRLFDNCYKENGIRFYCATLVSTEGGIPDLSKWKTFGPAHGTAYWHLVNDNEANYDYRFTPTGQQLAKY